MSRTSVNATLKEINRIRRTISTLERNGDLTEKGKNALLNEMASLEEDIRD
jgi:hypothetical protein